VGEIIADLDRLSALTQKEEVAVASTIGKLLRFGLDDAGSRPPPAVTWRVTSGGSRRVSDELATAEEAQQNEGFDLLDGGRSW
jgi:hypothetical protein